MSDEVAALLMFAALIFFVFLGYNLAFVLGGIAVFFGFIFWGAEPFNTQVFQMFVSRIYGVMTSYILAAVPMFVFMAVMLERSGVAERLFHAVHLWMGPVRGGIAVGILLISTVMAATTGIIGTAVVTMGLMGMPPMLNRGYDKGLASGTVCAGGTLGILIPPSIMLVILGDMMTLSVGRLFMGAIFPGLVLSGLYIAYILVRCYLQPSIAPAMPPEEREAVPLVRKFSLVFTAMMPPVFLIFAVLGTIFFGIATPTEAAGMGAFGAALLVLLNGRLNLDTVRQASIQTMRVSSMVFIILLGATAFTGVFIGLGGGKLASELILGLGLGKWGVLAVMMFVVFILGMFLDWIGIIFVILPIFVPIVATMGFDRIWFAMVLAVTLQTSFLTPPFAYALFYLKGVTGDTVSTPTLYRGVAPFIGLQLIGITAVALFPQLVLWLPEKMIK